METVRTISANGRLIDNRTTWILTLVGSAGDCGCDLPEGRVGSGGIRRFVSAEMIQRQSLWVPNLIDLDLRSARLNITLCVDVKNILVDNKLFCDISLQGYTKYIRDFGDGLSHICYHHILFHS